jgi:peroxiredoxin
MRPIEVGEVWPLATLQSVTGASIAMAPPARPVHLQLRRFAGCPVCNLHLRSFAERADEIEAAGILVVAAFRSPADALAPYQAELPLLLVADPDGQLYTLAGVGSSPAAMAHPSALGAALRGLWRTQQPGYRSQDAAFGLVGDVLIGTDGRVLALHRGAHANDQWDVDTLLALHRAASNTSRAVDRALNHSS